MAGCERNPSSPWNPARPAQVTPDEYEQQVVAWLKEAGLSLDTFNVRHRGHIAGSGGDYELDAVAEFTVLRGARVLVLVECKRNSRPVEREELLALEAKRIDVGAHKAMIFSTGGFQSGALQYAGSRGIATVTFLDGRFLYETRGRMPASPPPWVILPRFAAMMLREKDKQIMCSGIGGSDDSLREWITTAPPTSKL